MRVSPVDARVLNLLMTSGSIDSELRKHSRVFTGMSFPSSLVASYDMRGRLQWSFYSLHPFLGPWNHTDVLQNKIASLIPNLS